jgi:hypothetical protein
MLLPFYPITENLTATLLWITLSIFFGHISLNILTIDFVTMPGLEIKRKSAGRLFQLLDEINAEYRKPIVQKIIITEQYELKLVKIPHFGIPVFTHNILAIGLPLMLTLSPQQFEYLLTREMIHYSKKRPKIANWLSQLRESWERYRIALKQRSCIGHQLLYSFFTLYCPVYNGISLPARITDELSADRNALDLINSDALLSAFQAKLIAQTYFEKRFWMEVTNQGRGIRPFNRLNQIAKTALSQHNSDALLNTQPFSPQQSDEYCPTLHQRMDNLGLTSVKLPPDLKETAAEYFFQHHLAKIITMSDDNWQKKQRDYYPTQAFSLTGKPLSNNTVTNTADSHKASTA